MKFIVDSITRCAPRVGTLSEFERIPGATFETPHLFLCTKGGAIPHLTKDVFKTLSNEGHILSVPVSSTSKMAECIREISNSFMEFVSMKEYINFLTIHDPLETTTSGFQKLNSISIWPRSGRQLMNADKYMDIVEVFKPDLYVVLCDGDTNLTSGTKRVTNALKRSKILFESCLNKHMTSDVLKSKGILGAIEGGYDLEARQQSIDYMKDTPVAGFVIDGLHNNGPSVKDIPFDQIQNVIKHTIELLPADKLRVSMGGWNPVTLLDLVDSGIDIFDSSYPCIATEEFEALTFMCDQQCCQETSKILISQKSYRDDFSPICNSCECLACKNHSRAYLHHLNQTKEMLFSVLLMIHNTHTYLEFFKHIRNSIKNGSFQEFRNKIRLKFSSESEVKT